VAPENPPAVDKTEPGVNLTLEHVYGYRCFDTRQNVFYTGSGNEVVYMAASVGIVMDTSSGRQKFFGAGNVREVKGHSDDITALAIHPNGTLVATGEVGRNPKIIVWSTATMEPEAEFRQGNGSRAVTSLAFNRDGTLLVSTALDNEHKVRVWEWASGAE
jgi:microtubule-associated protein-like 6